MENNMVRKTKYIVKLSKSEWEKLTKQIRVPIPTNTDHVEYYDSEYERNGAANIFMFFNPIEGKRRVDITDNRSAKDWAQQIKQLVDVDYPEAKKLSSLWIIWNSVWSSERLK